MSIIQDKLGNEFLRNGGMDPNFTPGMLMFSHLPPVTSFTRLTSQSVMGELPQEMTLKKERDSPPDLQGGTINAGGFLHSMGIKQERLSELDYRMPMYATGGAVGMNCVGGGAGKSDTDMPDMSFSGHHPNHHNMLLHDLSLSNVRPLGEPVRKSSHWPLRPVGLSPFMHATVCPCIFAVAAYIAFAIDLTAVFASLFILQMPQRPVKEPKGSGRRRRGDGQGGKARRKRSDPAKVSPLSCSRHFQFLPKTRTSTFHLRLE